VENRINFHQMQVYDLAGTNWQFDLVLFLGVFYYLRYPLLAIDIISEVVNKLLVFQSMSLQQNEEYPVPDDVKLTDRDILLEIGWPSMAFIENKFMRDSTNWWIPNSAAIKAMFRTAGFDLLLNPAHEIYLFSPNNRALSVVSGWNKSELLSATGKPWKKAARLKTGFTNK
jgi:tRNA (mo5U34)-methyltransferase